MSLGTALSNVRWAERKAEVGLWASTAWAAAKRRLAARWMPIAAAVGILAVLVMLGELHGLAALGGALLLLLATAALAARFQRLHRSALRAVPAASSVNRTASDDRKTWRAVVDAIPTAALALDGAGTLVHHNRLATEMFPKIRSGQPMSQVSRSPDLLVAVDRVLAADERIDVDLVERVPVERRVAATVSRLEGSSASASPHAARHLPRSHRAGPPRADARRFHRQRQPRAAHAARIAARLRGDAAGPGARRCRGARRAS